nr:unnamed protein product [Digitaria exilis]
MTSSAGADGDRISTLRTSNLSETWPMTSSSSGSGTVSPEKGLCRRYECLWLTSRRGYTPGMNLVRRYASSVRSTASQAPVEPTMVASSGRPGMLPRRKKKDVQPSSPSAAMLRIEQRGGRVFVGWNEGNIYFPPTYKYSNNSDKYAGDDMNQKEKRRTPAWCDRILWYGRGLGQLSYVRGESRFSDHRPVYSVFSAEVESINHSRIQKMSCSSSQLDIEELLPYSYGYTDINPYGYTDLNFY